MKTKTMFELLVLGMSLTPLTCSAVGEAGEGLTGSHHDFTISNTSNYHYTTGAANNADGDPIADVGLCTYCHTPHKAQATLLLWNHKLSSQTFSWEVPATTAGTPLPAINGQTYNGATAKCLSCHDGTVALGDVALFYETTHMGSGDNDTGSLDSQTMNDVEPFFVMTGNNGAGAGSLNGNHPVAVPYPFNQAKNTYNGVTTGDGAILTDWQADPSNGSNIRLFTDTGGGNIHAGATAGQTGIECSSCHDPHNKQSVDDFFLRGKLTGSSRGDGYLCLQCHDK